MMQRGSQARCGRSAALPRTRPHRRLLCVDAKRRRRAPGEPTVGLDGAALFVARRDAEGGDDLGLFCLGVDDVGAGAATEPARALVVGYEDSRVAAALAILDPDLVALLEAVCRISHRAASLRANHDQVEVGVLVVAFFVPGAHLDRVWVRR